MIINYIIINNFGQKLRKSCCKLTETGCTSQVCDPSQVSYVLKQSEKLRSYEYNYKCHAQIYCAPTIYLMDIQHSFETGQTVY